MKHIDIDLENKDFADEVIRNIENDYGRSVARIADFKRTSLNTFDLKLVFTDFRVLEAEMKIVKRLYEPSSIEIYGTYY